MIKRCKMKKKEKALADRIEKNAKKT